MDDLTELLHHFELALAARDPADIEGGLMALIDDDFLEFGASGRTWDRESIRAIVQDAPPAPMELLEFHADLLADDVALVTYRTARSNRSSVWVRRDRRWRIRFHQGTARSTTE